jgi:hypothetical protein
LIPELARETEGVARHPRLSASPFLDEATRAAIAAANRGEGEQRWVARDDIQLCIPTSDQLTGKPAVC